MKAPKLTLCLLSVVAVGALAACGGSSSETSQGASKASETSQGASQTSAAEKEVTITWWNTYTPDPTPEDTSDDRNYAAYHYVEGVIKAFQTANPKITVNAVYKGNYANDYAGLASAVDSGLSTGDVPHIASTYGTYAIGWKDSLVDVTSHAEELYKDADFNKAYLDVEKQQYDGKFFSLPYSKSTDALMLNAEVMKAVGTAPAGENAGDYVAPIGPESKADYGQITSFEKLMEVAAQMKEDYPTIFTGSRDENNYIDACPVIYEDPANLFITLLESKGIPFVTADSNPVAATKFVDSAEAKELAVQLTKWNHQGLLATKNQFKMINSYSHEYPSTIFGQGKCFAILASTSGAPWMAADGYSVSWQKVPAYGDNGLAKSLSQGPSLAFFKKKDQAEVDAALKFYDFLTSKENSAALAAQTNYFPLRASSKEVDSIKPLIEAAKTPVTASSAYADKKNNYAGRVFEINDECMNGNNYFMSPVYSLAGKARAAVNNIITALFDDTTHTTDDQIKELVNSQFAAAKTSILG